MTSKVILAKQSHVRKGQRIQRRASAAFTPAETGGAAREQNKARNINDFNRGLWPPAKAAKTDQAGGLAGERRNGKMAERT
jgi:hypothetical protein